VQNSRPTWEISKGLVDYTFSIQKMEDIVSDIIENDRQGAVWLLEYPSIYTAGSSAVSCDLLEESKFPVYKTGRGGKFTYHGPGQRVAYFMLDLKKQFAPHDPDLKKYVFLLEELIIAVLREFGVIGERRPGRIGIWVETVFGEKKIAAIGIRVRKWVAYHGIAINVSPNLEHFHGIVPCGISEYGVTSLRDLGKDVSMDELDDALMRNFQNIFGETK